ncbi:8768_t:CDS:2 [Paraglomus brasilianum]|uniref:8768_t:CDS:1 n=1 Tax=Paraglomus brasilianum TaxID=144538 RepID=A0A9N9GPS1_9GLOM|nr:8768_t:CDS:2 [Paraglomus brasilianum]
MESNTAAKVLYLRLKNDKYSDEYLNELEGHLSPESYAQRIRSINVLAKSQSKALFRRYVIPLTLGAFQISLIIYLFSTEGQLTSTAIRVISSAIVILGLATLICGSIIVKKAVERFYTQLDQLLIEFNITDNPQHVHWKRDLYTGNSIIIEVGQVSQPLPAYKEIPNEGDKIILPPPPAYTPLADNQV